MRLLGVTILVITCLLVGDCTILSGSLLRQLERYKSRTVLLQNLLVSECPEFGKSRRQVDTGSLATAEVDRAKLIYFDRLRKLTECREKNAAKVNGGPKRSTIQTTKKAAPMKTTAMSTLPTLPTTTKQTTAVTTTKKPTLPTTKKFLPSTTVTVMPTRIDNATQDGRPIECGKATNLTEYWRMDHNGTSDRLGGPHSRNGWACDFHRDLQWLRFTGAAGNRMLNTCPKYRSCGTFFPYWTDGVMPSIIGMVTKVDVFGVYKSKCKNFVKSIQVMRCSWDTDHDLIYRYPTKYRGSCNEAFCGMISPNTTNETTAATTATTVVMPTTIIDNATQDGRPIECGRATNLTEYWRLDHNGTSYRLGGPHSGNGWACDFHRDLQWFRFTGAAGNKMLNTCPKYRSCGTFYPYWTDGVMPSIVGMVTKVDVFGVYKNKCKNFARLLQVMRCSWDTDHDLIYQYPTKFLGSCNEAFCGMS